MEESRQYYRRTHPVNWDRSWELLGSEEPPDATDDPLSSSCLGVVAWLDEDCLDIVEGGAYGWKFKPENSLTSVSGTKITEKKFDMQVIAKKVLHCCDKHTPQTWSVSKYVYLSINSRIVSSERKRNASTKLKVECMVETSNKTVLHFLIAQSSPKQNFICMLLVDEQVFLFIMMAGFPYLLFVCVCVSFHSHW